MFYLRFNILWSRWFISVISVCKNLVYVNGFNVNPINVEKKVKFTNDEICEFKNTTLEEQEYFLVGDNFENSYDSRYFGIILKKQIISKSLYRIRNGKAEYLSLAGKYKK